MQKTVIYTIPYRWKKIDKKYIPDSDFSGDYYDHKVFFPINHVILNEIEKTDDVKAILVVTKSEDRADKINQFVIDAKKEISSLFSDNCNSLEIKEINVPFSSNKNDLGLLYKELCQAIPKESHCFADVTFGEKYLLMLNFCVLNYAEKYLSCEVHKLVYGRINGENDKDGQLVDFTPLYLLNSFGNTFDGKKENFDLFVSRIFNK